MADQEYKVRISLDGAQQAASGAQKVDSAIGGIGKRALEAGAAMFAAGGIIAGLQKVSEYATRAVQVNKVADAFAGIAVRSGLAANTIDRLRSATRGAVSDFELMKSANTIMLLGVTKSSEQMTEMAEIARRLGNAVGLDAVSALDSLVIGLGRQSKLMLDNLGIIVDMDEAYRNYAKQLGKTVDQLTDAEKKTGFTNETMKKARELVSGLGDDSEKTGDSLSRLNAEWQNTKDNLDELIPVATGVAWVFNKIAAAAGLVLKGEESEVWAKSTSELKIYLDALNSGLGAQFANRLVSTHGDGLVEMFDKLRAAVELTKREMGNADFVDSLLVQIKNAQAAYDAAEPERQAQERERLAAAAKASAAAAEAEAAAIRKRQDAFQEMSDGIATEIALRNEAQAFKESMIISTDDEIASLTDYGMAAYEAADSLQFLGTMEKKVAQMQANRAEERRALVSAGIGDLARMNQAAKGSALVTKRLMQAQALNDARSAYSGTYGHAARLFPFPIPQIMAGVAFAAVASQAAAIESQSFREGGVIEGAGGPRQDNQQINVSRGESILNAEATARIGRDGIDRLNNGGGAGVTVIINGGMIGNEGFVRDVMIPQIEASLKRRLA